MNPDRERQLEALIDRELKALPDLPAPATLATRVLRAIDARARKPWHQCAWQEWPLAVRIASFATLAALFGGICLLASQLMRADQVAGLTTMLGRVGAALGALGRVGEAVLGGLLMTVKNFGTGYIVAGLIAVAFSYAACVALGTVYVRLGLARTGKDIL